MGTLTRASTYLWKDRERERQIALRSSRLVFFRRGEIFTARRDVNAQNADQPDGSVILTVLFLLLLLLSDVFSDA